MDCGTTRTRKDFLYTREGLALGAHYDIGSPFRPDGLGWYLAVGRYF